MVLSHIKVGIIYSSPNDGDLYFEAKNRTIIHNIYKIFLNIFYYDANYYS